MATLSASVKAGIGSGVKKKERAATHDPLTSGTAAESLSTDWAYRPFGKRRSSWSCHPRARSKVARRSGVSAGGRAISSRISRGASIEKGGVGNMLEASGVLERAGSAMAPKVNEGRSAVKLCKVL